ncbi:hypothetical protein AN643_01510 [Candidatus Epulonipiscioides saccharophilum]|nr:hypothetical protein AN643_01510 [Epulopiscium sp. SCG-B10WGA-EpuloB]
MQEFEYDEVVEISSMITANGPVPITIGKMPKCTKGLLNQIKSFEIATCEAVISGDYNKALLAMMINPLVSSQKYAIKILDEMFEAHKKYLPTFNK